MIGKSQPIDEVMSLQRALSEEADVQVSDVTKVNLWGMPGGDNAITSIDVVELQEIWNRAQRDNRQNRVGNWYYSGKINGHPKTFPTSSRVIKN